MKIALADAEEGRRRLASAGFAPAGPRSLEDNWVYDDARASLRGRRALLRVRAVAGSALLTYKTPAGDVADDRGYKVRLEYETRVADADVMRRILEGLGYQVSYRYQKFRQPFSAQDIVLTLDETPRGAYLELEGEPASIDRTAAQLGYGPEHYVTKSYLQIFTEHEDGPVRETIFDPEAR